MHVRLLFRSQLHKAPLGQQTAQPDPGLPGCGGRDVDPGAGKGKGRGKDKEKEKPKEKVLKPNYTRKIGSRISQLSSKHTELRCLNTNIEHSQGVLLDQACVCVFFFWGGVGWFCLAQVSAHESGLHR